MASDLQWDEEDMFHHLCASLDGQVVSDIGLRVTMVNIVCLFQTRFRSQLQAERFKAELMQGGGLLGVPPATVPRHLYCGLLNLAYPSAEASLVTHVGKNAL